MSLWCPLPPDPPPMYALHSSKNDENNHGPRGKPSTLVTTVYILDKIQFISSGCSTLPESNKRCPPVGLYCCLSEDGGGGGYRTNISSPGNKMVDICCASLMIMNVTSFISPTVQSASWIIGVWYFLGFSSTWLHIFLLTANLLSHLFHMLCYAWRER